MARLTIRSNRSLIRKGAPTLIRRSAAPDKASQGQVEFDTSIDALDKTEAAEMVEVSVKDELVYLADVDKDGNRYNQRFYRTGLLQKDNAGALHDVVMEVVPRIPKGFIVDAEPGARGILVVKAAKAINVFKYTAMSPDNPNTAFRKEFAAKPDFVSFGGKPLVDTNPPAEEESPSAED